MAPGPNGKPVEVSRTWKPDLMDSVYKQISREASLMGYTWKRRETGKKDRYGVCFIDQLGRLNFADTKAPNGWGGNEPANIRLWLERMKAETAKKRETARAALLSNIDQSKDLTPEPDPLDE